MKNVFRERILDLRMQSNLTQVALAQKLNVSQSTLSAWERGHEASYNFLVAIADFFDVTIDYLLGRTEI